MTILIHPAIEVPNELAMQYARTLDNLKHLVFSHGLNRELLGSRARVYSVRINRKARLLIAPYRDEQRNMSWVVLDCLSEHKYESPFLRISQHALEQQIRAISRTQESAPAQLNEGNEDGGEVQAEEEAPFPQELSFYQDKWIQLSTEQDKAVVAKLPLVINGIAGSGKTCVAESSLNQAASEATRAAPAVFVATSSKLVEKIQQSYRRTYGESDTVLFLTYQQLLARVLMGKEFVNDEHTIACLSARTKIHKQLSAYVPTLSVERLCLEFRQVCIFKEKELERYLGIGSRHSVLSDEDKRWVFAAYQAYRAELIKHNLVHPDLYHEGVGVSFSFVVADESQDLSPAALSTLSTIVPSDEGNPRIVYLVDANQSLQNGNFQVVYHLQRIVGEDHIITLPNSYRSPLAVIDSANSILSLRNSILGGVFDRFTQSTLAKAENQVQGQMVWTDRASENKYQAMWADASQTTDFAVVTQAAHVEEARLKFNTPLVLTPAQIKGFEYKDVLVYRLIEGEQVKIINEKVKKGELKNNVHRARRDESSQDNMPLAIYFNELFTSFTRALSRLFVYQETTHQNKEMMVLLNFAPQPSSQMEKPTHPVMVTEVKPTITDVSAWRDELARQQDVGNQEVVNAIQEKLHKLNQEVIVQPSPSIAPNEHSIEIRRNELTMVQSDLSSEIIPQASLTYTAEAASSVLSTRDETIVLDPLRALSPGQCDYVEKFFLMITPAINQRDKKQAAEQHLQREKNVSSLLNHKRAYMMLFVHKMKNGQCLFENLVEHNVYNHFSPYAKKSSPNYLSLLGQVISYPELSTKLMTDILTVEWEGTHPSFLEKLRDHEKQKIAILGSLVVIESGLKLLDLQWTCFKRLFTLETFNQPLSEFRGQNLLSILVQAPKGCEFLKKKWNEIKPFITPGGLNSPADNQASALSELLNKPEGMQLFIEKWHDFKSLLTSEGLNRPELGPDEGINPLFNLVSAEQGSEFLKKRWHEIKPFFTAAGLNQPVKNAHFKNDTPLNRLIYRDGDLKLLPSRWQDIKPLLTSEGVNGVADASICFIQLLAGKPESCQILQGIWDDIKPYLAADTLTREIIIPEARGQSLLYELAYALPSCSLLYDKWDDIKPFLTAEALNRPIPATGVSAFFLLTSHSEGIKLLREKWADIRPYLTLEGLNTSSTVKGESLGSALFALIRFANEVQGYAFLKQIWEDIKPLLTKEGLVPSSGVPNPFSWLLKKPEGRAFLIEKCEDIFSIITPQGFTQPLIGLLRQYPETQHLCSWPIQAVIPTSRHRFYQPEQPAQVSFTLVLSAEPRT